MNDRTTTEFNTQCVIACHHYDGKGSVEAITLEAISDVLAVEDGSYVWLALYEPDELVLGKVQEEFHLHDLAVEDARVAHQRPKIESYGDSVFIAVRTAQTVDQRVRFGETHFFVGKRFLVTVRHGSSLSYRTARARFEREPELMAQGTAGGLYVVLDLIVDNFQPLMDEFSAQLTQLERDILSEDFKPNTIRELYTLKQDLTRLRIAAAPIADIISQLTRLRKELITDEIQLYLRDVQDHAIRLNDGIDTLREMLSAAMSTNLSLVTVHQGEVVKRLGAWAALLGVPTLVASWYGMNFKFMPELEGKWSYAVLIGLVALICIVLYRRFRKAQWL